MLCPSCRRQVTRGAGWCASCGRPLGGAGNFDLVLPDGTRVAIVGELTIGRGAGNGIVLEDPSVSRAHARVAMAPDGPTVEDAGSSHGTWLDGRRVVAPAGLRAGARVQLGDAELRVEARRDERAAGETIVVRPGASLVVNAVGAPTESRAAGTPMRPRVRSGWALKRLEAGEGEQRWILRDLRGGGFTRMGAPAAQLFPLLDGSHELPDLIVEAERRFGVLGPGLLARLLADLGERGLLEGVAARDAPPPEPPSRLKRLAGPREKAVEDASGFFDRLYRRGGWTLFSGPALALAGAVIVAGLAAFVYLIVGRYGTPFVVARKLGIGGAVFLVGRFALVFFHEAAHGLAMASYGRRVGKAGIKLLFILPYGFVDTSEAWFEPRRHRIAVAAAGPALDLALGGVFALACALLAPGALRDIFFQLAFASYVGGLLNLNPFLDRDGYHIMVDVFREPGLRRRSREQLARRLSGRPPAPGDSPLMVRFGVAGIVWSVVAAGFAIFMSTRYYPVIARLAPKGVVLAVFGAFYVLLFIPVIASVARPLSRRWAQGAREAGTGRAEA